MQVCQYIFLWLCCFFGFVFKLLLNSMSELEFCINYTQDKFGDQYKLFLLVNPEDDKPVAVVVPRMTLPSGTTGTCLAPLALPHHDGEILLVNLIICTHGSVFLPSRTWVVCCWCIWSGCCGYITTSQRSCIAVQYTVISFLIC